MLSLPPSAVLQRSFFSVPVSGTVSSSNCLGHVSSSMHLPVSLAKCRLKCRLNYLISFSFFGPLFPVSKVRLLMFKSFTLVLNSLPFAYVVTNLLVQVGLDKPHVDNLIKIPCTIVVRSHLKYPSVTSDELTLLSRISIAIISNRNKYKDDGDKVKA